MPRPILDEEHIHPDEAPGERPEARVEQDHGHDRNGPQSIDFRAIFHQPPQPIVPSRHARRPPLHRYSHSIVAGGLLLTSYTTRLTPFTSFAIRFEMCASTSCGNGNQSAVIPSRLVTARSATA